MGLIVSKSPSAGKTLPIQHAHMALCPACSSERTSKISKNFGKARLESSHNAPPRHEAASRTYYLREGYAGILAPEPFRGIIHHAVFGIVNGYTSIMCNSIYFP